MTMYSILVVDDEPNYLVVLSELLKDEGFEVFTASDGLKGLEIVEAVDLDIVITDMQMPGMNGLQFLNKVKEKNEHLPVIVITAFAEIDARSLLCARLQHHVVTAHRFDQFLSFNHGIGQRLLQIDILAGLTGGDSDQAVPVGRRGDDHGIDVRLLEQIAEVMIGFRTLLQRCHRGVAA